MTTMQTVKCAAALVLAASLTVHAQGAGGGKGGAQKDGPGGQGCPGRQQQRPSPEKMAEQMIAKHDTDKDGKLSLSELTQALEALRANRPKGGPGGGQGNGQGGGGPRGGGPAGVGK